MVDASKCKMYIKNFGEFFINQIEYAGTIILSRTGDISKEKLDKAIELIREHNEKAAIVTTPWDQIEGDDILAAIEGAKDLEAEMMAEVMAHHHEEEEHHHHHEHCHHDHEEGHEHCHHDHEEGHEHCHHDHDHGHGPECNCGCHGHDHHHHHADEVFASWGMETPTAYSKDEVERILEELEDESKYGFVLRAKGMVQGTEGGWVYFDYVPGESNVRNGRPDVTGKFCVIGSGLKEDALHRLFSK